MNLSLLTPPNSAHRGDKENRFQPSSSRTRVVWSVQHQIYSLASEPKLVEFSSAARQPPVKSILKKTKEPLLPLLDVKPREVTPEPTDPLRDAHYLEGPVLTITSPLATHQELNEAYGRLMARLRGAVKDPGDVDASWPLFYPLRQSRKEFVASIIRDLRKALEDPADKFTKPMEEDSLAECNPEPASCLPSPKSTPKKKKGMSAEQVKYARDLCTTSHSAMKFLGLILTWHTVYPMFAEQELREMLTELLAIPTTEALPTPNARKTCALAIWVIQVQRLPPSVLQPLSDRIAYVIRRGLDGELGKEGKKGSASDGLKAIHDLSVSQPTTFIPAFTNILDSVLSNLLAPTLALRLQACHALGGIVLGLTSLPRSSLHTRISNLVTDYITRPASPKKPHSPSKLLYEPPIFRTLIDTLNACDPIHVAQGPVWALIVLACFIILLGPTLIHTPKIFRSLTNLLSLPMRHKKSSVRAIGCMVWRSVAWVYFQPQQQNDSSSSESSLAHDMLADRREVFWRSMINVTDLQTGQAIIAALLGAEYMQFEDAMKRSFVVLENMLMKQQNIADVIDTLRRLVNVESILSGDDDSDTRWHVNKLIMPSIFAAAPGLLTAEYKNLSEQVNEILVQSPVVEDIRSLTREEIAQEWVFEGVVRIWRQTLGNVKKFSKSDVEGIKADLLAVWEGLLKGFRGGLLDGEDDENLTEFSRKAADVLVDILEDNNLDLMTTSMENVTTRTMSKVKSKTNGHLKLEFVLDLWRMMCTVFPENSLRRAGERLLACLMKIEDELIESSMDARAFWVEFCTKVLAVCDVDAVKMFWGYEAGGFEWDWTSDVRSAVWQGSVASWIDNECGWEGAVILLAVPFTESMQWNLSSEVIKKWDYFLEYTFNKAFDYGIDSIVVLDTIAAFISHHCDPTQSSSNRVADLLLSHMDMSDIREIPETLMDFVNETMRSSYPPEPRNQDFARWMIRTLTCVVEKCPMALRINLLDSIQEGVSMWVADEHKFCNADDYEYEILPLYVQVMLCIQSLPQTLATLEKYGGLLQAGFIGRPDKPKAVKEHFQDFWSITYGTWKDLPAGGWPEGIQQCLGIKSEIAMDGESSIDEEDVPATSPASSALDLPRPSTPESNNLFSDIVPATPMTPVSCVSYSRPSSPLKYLKSADQAEKIFRGFVPTVSPTMSPMRIIKSTPSTPKKPGKRMSNAALVGGSPSKRRKIEMERGKGNNKENERPHVFGIGGSSMKTELDMGLVSSMLNTSRVSMKRRLEEDIMEGDLGLKRTIEGLSPLKNGWMNKEAIGTGNSSSNASMDDAEEPLAEKSSSVLKVQSTLVRPNRLFLEAVEVPSFEEVLFMRRLRRSASVNDLDGHSVLKTPSTTGRMIRKMRPAPKSSTKMSNILDPFAISSSPIRTLHISESNKLTRAASDSRLLQASWDRSSDDDPRYGQVTPHHLISPEPKKIVDLFGDLPSSDDSIPSSPIKDIVNRSIKRRKSCSELV